MDENKLVHLRLPAKLVAKIDARAGEASRTQWITRALEEAVGDKSHRFRGQPGPDVTRLVSSARAKRDVVPIPKTGKKR